MAGQAAPKESAAKWKEHLIDQGYTLVTLHSTLAVLNCLFHFHAWDECRVKFLKIQRQMFRDVGRDLTRAEYKHLLTVVQKCGQGRLALLMETICATGIRVSEVRYITVEAALKGSADISLKGKIRTIPISTKLAKKLLKYAKAQKPLPVRLFSQEEEKVFLADKFGWK